MARSILSDYGPDSNQPQASSAGCGGVLPGYTKDVRNYQMPMGPKGIMNPQSPGLHGKATSAEQRPISNSHSGSAGIGGTNHGCCGSQGKY